MCRKLKYEDIYFYTKNKSRGGKYPSTRLKDFINREISKLNSQHFENFYEEDEENEYYEEDKSVLEKIDCILCKEALFLTPPSKKLHQQFIKKVVKLLKRKGINNSELKLIEKLSYYPICRWDLLELVSTLVKNKELKGLIKNLVKFYDFDNIEK
ncbi:MAG: hypothetical protein QXP34_00620 [Candidatus Aenigmatarchaeota archaeon]